MTTATMRRASHDKEGPPLDAMTKAGQLIQARRERLGISKSAAARAARVSVTTWRLVEAGRAENPTDQTITRMARAVHLDPEVVMTAAGREWDESAHRLGVEHLVPTADAPPADPLARGHEEQFAAVLADNPLLDDRARAHLLEMYRLLVQRGTA